MGGRRPHGWGRLSKIAGSIIDRARVFDRVNWICLLKYECDEIICYVESLATIQLQTVDVWRDDNRPVHPIPPDIELNSEDDILLSIVVPAYNEERRLPDTLEQIRSHLAAQSFRWEAIVVDDGSGDESAAIVEQMVARDGRFRLIRNPHAGKGYAVRTGILAARGNLIFMADADLSMPMSETSKFLPLAQNDVDVVIGSREAKGAKRLDEPYYRHLMGRVFNLLVQAMLVPGIKDTQCGFKCFRRPVARAIFGNLRLYSTPKEVVGPMVTGFDVEVLYLARKWGLQVREIPVIWHHSPTNNVNPVRDTLRMLSDIVRVRLNDLGGQYPTAPAELGHGNHEK